MQFWSLSACSFSSETPPPVSLDDRLLAPTSLTAQVFRGKSVLDRTDHSVLTDKGRELVLVTSDQVKALNNDYACVCLDPSSEGRRRGARGRRATRSRARARRRARHHRPP